MSLNPISENELLEALRWRYATKMFDPSRKIPPSTWTALEETLRLSASTFGLQPYRFLVVEDPAKRNELLPHSWNQRQVVEASHLVVFAVRTDVTEAEIDTFLQIAADVRGTPVAALAGYRNMMTGTLLSEEFAPVAVHWASRQAYLALGNLMTGAALLGVDTCPLEGFEPSAYDRLLGLTAEGLTAAVGCALGYRSSDDKHARLAKVRLPAEKLIRHI